MSYRGVVKSGVVVLDPSVHLAEGQTVEVTEIAATSAELPAAGLWRDREDIVDSANESLRIRRNLEQRGE